MAASPLPRAAALRRPSLTALLFLVAAMVSVPPVAAEIRETGIRADPRSIIPLDEFGFSHSGVLELNVSGIAFDPQASAELDLSQLGFFLSTLDAWVHVLRQLQDLDVTCALQSELVKLAFSFDRLRPPSNPAGVEVARSSSFSTAFRVNEPGQYTLVFANCLGGGLKVDMDVRSAMYNVDPATGERQYLSAGASALPSFYFLFCLAYAGLAAAWVAILLRKRVAVFRIHYFMLAVLVLKALNLLAEAEDKSCIERTGTAHGWDVLFYIFSFLKGISLFTLIVLIGTGWSFLKPYLADREKKVLMVVIPLQVVANIAQVVIDESGPYARDWVTWKQIFLLVDVVCCCAVLFPIVWSIKNLREAARSDGKAAVNLMKLTLFRQYYVVVICYIYFTRVVVYALQTITSYRYLWTSVVAGELATLAFYVFTGYKFRPEVHNPYFAIDDEEEEAAAEALKLDDEFEL
ncbi:protein CANDIDATE G-PROTEIN COUPLED RECEPTOR 7-like [Miscanthus floridulus]|uniref:protein CANDIDATE G-PROTEIN COUPLED RECEPTOR 7-like n=1 Tax=Miscanthus floridulus TaxID=154761 RepID=UPI0034575EA6